MSPCLPKNLPRNPVLRLTLKSSMYTRYCCLRNRWRKRSPWDQSSTSDADIFCANRLLLTDKPLTKNKSLVSHNSSLKRSSTVDAEIFNVHRLLLAQKPLTKTRSLGPKNHPRSPVQRLTLTSSAQTKYSSQTNRWQKNESLPSQKSSSKPSSTADAEIFNVHTLLLPQKPLTKMKSLGPKFYVWRWHLLCK